MRFGLFIFLTFCLSSCVSYTNDDSRVGGAQKLSSLRQLQGTYASYTQEELKATALYRYNLAQVLSSTEDTRTWSYDTVGTSSFVRVVYINEKQLHLQALDQSGRVIAERWAVSPKDFTFQNGALLWSDYDLARNSYESRRTQTVFMLNPQGNLIKAVTKTDVNPLVLIAQKRTGYYEYQRVQ